MKTFVGFSVLLLVMGTALVCSVSYGKGVTSSTSGTNYYDVMNVPLTFSRVAGPKSILYFSYHRNFLLELSSRYYLYIHTRVLMSPPYNCLTTGMSLTSQGNELTTRIKSRKLQGNGYRPRADDEEGEAGKINLEDYRHPMDPVPSSKAYVRPGPIQHGTPLMPYIPKQPSPPPSRSKPVGFP